MTIYQKEMLRMLPSLECEGKYNPETEMLDISYHKISMCSQNKNGFIFEDARSRVTGNLAEIQDSICISAEKIREYVSLYESSPQMTIPDVKEYRKLSEFGDTVLAAMYSEQHGFMFTTWKQNNAKTYVTHGDCKPLKHLSKKLPISQCVWECRLTSSKGAAQRRRNPLFCFAIRPKNYSEWR